VGNLVKVWKTIPMPKGAMVGLNGTVHWTVKGKKRTGKISKSGTVSVQSDTWTAQFRDENGKTQRISTKTTVRSVAERVLAQYQTEVDRIRTGVATRDELSKVHFRSVTLEKALEQFKTKMIASGNGATHIDATQKRIAKLCSEAGIETLADIRRESVEKWIAVAFQKKVVATRTINAYLAAINTFVQYLVDAEILSKHPLKVVKKLNEEIDRRKKRRALSADEVSQLLKAAEADKPKWKAGERVLIYRLLLGTGLRSTELSLLVPNQVDFKRNRLTVDAAKTKNKKADVLPLRADLVQSLAEWIEKYGIQSNNRVFQYDADALRYFFYKDLKAAGIERIGADGRSVDVHSLRKTFGTLLAKAGVPLTTVQRLMRHSTPLLTAKLYIDVEAVDMMQAVEKLPGF
jgi:integrase